MYFPRNESSFTYELFLLVRDEFGDFVFAGGELFLVVGEVSNDELLLPGVQFEFFYDFFEQRYGEETVLGILRYENRRSRHYHVCDFFVPGVPLVERVPAGRKIISTVFLPL